MQKRKHAEGVKLNMTYMSSTLIDPFRNEIDFSYERDDFASYLVLKVQDEGKLINYQLDMMINNRIPGLLPLDVRHKNNETYFYYNITSKITLLQFLKRTKIKKDQLIGILLQIIETMLAGMNFLLYNKCFIFQENYIYINPATCEIYLIYAPIQVEADVNNVLRNFILNLVMYSADIADESNSNDYLLKILDYVRCDTFNVSDFDKLLIKLSNEENGKTEKEYESFKEFEEPYKPISIDEKICGLSKNSVNTKKKKIETNPANSSTLSAKLKKHRTQLLIFVVIQAIIVLVVLMYGNFVKLSGGNIKTSYFGIGIIVLCLEVLIFKNLFNKTNKENIVDGAKEDKADTDSDKQQKSQFVNNSIYNINKSGGNNICNGIGFDNINCDNYTKQKCHSSDIEIHSDMNDGFSNNTVLLSEEKNRKPFLRFEADGIIEETHICKDDFIIGRLNDKVDYSIKNNAVGKMHAQITNHEGKYYVKDLNSINGTYLNKVRIESNIEYEIKDGDRIIFANSEYIFILR